MKTFNEFSQNFNTKTDDISQLKFTKENFLKLIDYSNYLAETLDKSIAYSNYLAEEMDKLPTYLNLKYNKEYEKYIEYLKEEKTENEIKNLFRKNKIKNLLHTNK